MEGISQRQLRDLAATATGLRERLQTASTGSGDPSSFEPTPEATRAVSSWKRAFAAGDQAAFSRRLAWDDLDELSVMRALSRSPEIRELPEWTRWLPRFLEQARSGGEAVPAGPWRPSEEPPFLEVWAPFLLAARKELGRRAARNLRVVSPPAMAALERQLIREVALISELAMYERFRGHQDQATGKGAYRTFVDGMLEHGLCGFFDEYPALSRQIARLVETWTTTVEELVARLDEDRAAIAEAFSFGIDPGQLTRARPALSDRHHGGRRVIALGFESGLRLIYKPRDVGLERAFHEFVKWCGARGLDHAPKTLLFLERQDYGWVEYVTAGGFDQVEQVRDYFRQAGSLLCLTWILGGKDLHMENLIASSDGPALVDTETLVQPGQDPTLTAASDGSCLSSGLLTLLSADPRGKLYDVGGLRGRGGFLTPAEERRWKDLGTDKLHFEEQKVFAPEASNRVVLDDDEQRPEAFRDELVDGFTRTYRFLLQHRDEILAESGPLSMFADQEARVLLRDSKQYAVLLHTLAQPKYQRSGLDRAVLIEALHRIHSAETDKPRLWPLVADESVDLEGQDIPRFTVRASEAKLVSSRGETVEGYFTHAGLTLTRERLDGLGDADLRQQTDRLLDALLSPTDARFECAHEANSAAGLDDESADLIDCANWAGRELLHRARESDGELTWRFMDHEVVRTATECPYDLHDGAAGVALFLAALGVVTKESHWFDAARAAINPVVGLFERTDAASLTEQHSIGIDGVGSVVYTACLLARLVEDDSFLELANRASRVLGAERIEADRTLDLMSGTAGALLAFLTLHGLSGEPRALSLARVCGKHLVASRVITRHGGVAWPATDRRLLAGFAHGAAGISFALGRLFVATEEREFFDAAAGAYRYERSLYEPKSRNWPIIEGERGGGEPMMYAWCHGAPGIGLGRALALDILHDDEVRGEIGNAVLATANPKLSRSDHLCCGNLGRAEILLTIGRRVRNPDIVTASEEITRGAMQRGLEQGHFGLPGSAYEYRVFQPGFFRGVAGIGYQFLRAAVPDRLPSILALQPDSETGPS